MPDGVYTATIEARSVAGQVDMETIHRGFVPQQWIGTFDAPEVIRGPFALEAELETWFLEFATVTDITLWCYQTDGVQTEIGSIDAVGSDGPRRVLGDSGPCPLGEHNLLDCRLTWLDPFGVEHYWDCSRRVTLRCRSRRAWRSGWSTATQRPRSTSSTSKAPSDVALCLSGPATVDAVVVDGSGAVVRTLAEDQAFPQSPCDSNPPETVLTWDHLDEAGGARPSG